jgi:hypothetical protein
VQFSPASCYSPLSLFLSLSLSLSLGFKYPHQYSVLRISEFISLPRLKVLSFTLIRNTRRNYGFRIFYYLCFS